MQTVYYLNAKEVLDDYHLLFIIHQRSGFNINCSKIPFAVGNFIVPKGTLHCVSTSFAAKQLHSFMYDKMKFVYDETKFTPHGRKTKLCPSDINEKSTSLNSPIFGGDGGNRNRVRKSIHITFSGCSQSFNIPSSVRRLTGLRIQ